MVPRDRPRFDPPPPQYCAPESPPSFTLSALKPCGFSASPAAPSPSPSLFNRFILLQKADGRFDMTGVTMSDTTALTQIISAGVPTELAFTVVVLAVFSKFFLSEKVEWGMLAQKALQRLNAAGVSSDCVERCIQTISPSLQLSLFIFN